MKLSVSIDDADVAFIDQYSVTHRVGSRSAVLQRAVSLLRESELGDDYAAAWAEWSGGDDAAGWDAVTGDGLTEAG